jgi:CDP-diacylglycerol--glycerol-3-phosphate 3-phosphatidyltransferase
MISASRFVCAAFFPFVPHQIQIYIFFYAGMSELLDGFFARLLKAETDFGQFIDPVADKTFILTVIVTLMYQGHFSVYHLILLGYRDLTVIAGALVVLASGNKENFDNMGPEWVGKVMTGCQFGLLFYVIYYHEVPPIIFSVMAVFSIFSAIYYTKIFFDKNLHTSSEEALTPLQNRARVRELSVLVGLVMLFGLFVSAYSYLYTAALMR